MGDYAEALRRAQTDGRATGSEEPRASASAPATPPDWVPHPVPEDEDEEERACDASLAPWRQEAIAEEPSKAEAEPLEIRAADLTRRIGESPETAGRIPTRNLRPR